MRGQESRVTAWAIGKQSPPVFACLVSSHARIVENRAPCMTNIQLCCRGKRENIPDTKRLLSKQQSSLRPFRCTKQVQVRLKLQINLHATCGPLVINSTKMSVWMFARLDEWERPSSLPRTECACCEQQDVNLFQFSTQLELPPSFVSASPEWRAFPLSTPTGRLGGGATFAMAW